MQRKLERGLVDSQATSEGDPRRNNYKAPAGGLRTKKKMKKIYMQGVSDLGKVMQGKVGSFTLL